MKTLALVAALAVLTTSAFAGTVKYDPASPASAIAVDRAVRAENAVKVYPVDPTPKAYLVNTTCTGFNAFGCTAGAGGAAAAAAGE